MSDRDLQSQRRQRTSKAELGYFFETEIRPGLRGGEHSAFKETFPEVHARFRTSPAHRQALAILDTESVSREAPFSATPLDVRQSVLVVLHEITQYFASKALENRVFRLEQDLNELRHTFFCHIDAFRAAAGKVGEVGARLKEHLSAIHEAGEVAFGSTPHIAVLPADDPERVLAVALDFRDADAGRLTEARASGGRRRFYEAVMHSVPRDLFDQLDFAFHFPTK
jgi:hypothetical protein